MLKLTARHADVWNVSGAAGRDPESAAAASRELDQACAAIGRDPGEIRRSVQLPAGEDPSQVIERARGFAEAGFTEIIIMLSGGSMSTQVNPVDTAEMLAEQVLPALRD
jgi:hypothetical protein